MDSQMNDPTKTATQVMPSAFGHWLQTKNGQLFPSCSSFQHSLQLKNVSWKFTYLQSCNYKCKVFIRLAKNTT